MSVLVDTSVIIDYLRGHAGAQRALEEARSRAPLHASEMTRLEVLAEMRTHEEGSTRALLSVFNWHPIDALIAERAGEMGRRWLPSHRSIDSADLAIAATVIVTGCEFFTCNIKHFPMFTDLERPY
jgi:predicted nucleic acid-binding protein